MTVTTLARTVAVEGRPAVSAALHLPKEPTKIAVLLAHGAGANMQSEFMVAFAEGLAERGLATLRFNFPYLDGDKRRPPDPTPVLQRTLMSAAALLRAEVAPEKLVIGGKSMGGRMASMVAAKGFACEGLLLLGYPLHPPKKPTSLRTAHLPSIQTPTLFVQGTRDTLCDLDLLRPVLETMGKRARLHVVAGGDHSFDVLKSLKRSQADVRAEVMDVIAAWAEGL